jgi:hypothetical protein
MPAINSWHFLPQSYSTMHVTRQYISHIDIFLRIEIFSIRSLFSLTLYTYDSDKSTKKCNSFTSLLLDVYVWLDMYRALPRPLSGAYNCIRSLWFYRWGVAVAELLVVVWQTTTNNAVITMPQR